MGTHCQTAARSKNGEGQDIGVVNSFENKGTVKFKQIRVVTCKMCWFSLYLVKYMKLNALWKKWSPCCIQFCI